MNLAPILFEPFMAETGAVMARLEESKQRLERALARLEQSVAKAQHLRDENQSLARALNNVQATEQQLRTAAADALAEVDQAIALIVAQASTEGERVEPLVSSQTPPAQEIVVDAPDLALADDHDQAPAAEGATVETNFDADDPEGNSEPESRVGMAKVSPILKANDPEEAEDAYQAGLELWATASPAAASSEDMSTNDHLDTSETGDVLSSDAALSVSSDVDSIDADDGATHPLLDLAEHAAPAELFDVDDDDDDDDADAEDFFEDEVFDDADAFVGDDVTDVVEDNLDETSDEDDHEWGAGALAPEEPLADDVADDESENDKKSPDGSGGSWSFLDD